MSILDRQNTISSAFKKIHKDISDSLKAYEDLSKIQDDIWEKNDLGYGNSIVIDDGNFFDKAGINFSSISGKSLPESSVGSKSILMVCLFSLQECLLFSILKTPTFLQHILMFDISAHMRKMKSLKNGLGEGLTLHHTF